jgi:multiple sugar transport system permease protein
VSDVIPWPIRWRNFYDVLSNKNNNFLLWMRNSLMVTLLSVIGTTSSSALVAYGFARIKFRGRGVMLLAMISTMMIPFPVTMVALFNIWKWLTDHTGIDFIGTFRPLWLPTFFGSAFNIFLLRQFFMTIPKDISDAARIDGCSEFGIFWRVILPLSKPALSVVALFAFMWSWNDFMAPLVYLKRADQFTLALGLQNYQSQQNGTPWHLLMAASVLVVTPVLMIFFIAQKSFIQGISTTGSKG